ncbi:MAG TPA: glycosyl transferase family 2, partial [Bryobacterales bacterium]|nr:glycosyl transferase family 2 [Bryobacterales bacterium]
MLATIAPVGLVVADSWVERISRTFFDDTFAGIHQLQWFDYAILIPYFTALAILGFYGLHRYI